MPKRSCWFASLSEVERVVGLGAGGHAKVVIDTLNLLGCYELVGLLDSNRELWNTNVLGIPVLGDDDLLPQLWEQGVRHAFVGLGGAGNTEPRRRVYCMARECRMTIVDAIHPSAVVASSAKLGNGPTILANAVVNADARLGDNVTINTGAIVEHECIISDHVHIATGARLGGGVYVGSGSHIGLGASVRQDIRIGENAIVGAGAVVVKDVPDGVVVVGVPARILAKSLKA